MTSKNPRISNLKLKHREFRDFEESEKSSNSSKEELS
tara:strand:- start:404 stop:514 length:111 start_codon:yes stop_codon:yes gene_type:complete